ncbi:hypothetical protein ELUMI_v1c05710 [Williamsoniiplasma luminosum]|uniref:DUF262 domain-containing protein n=1 Tax=Williamsoniiplasma luminosum TaxID=214888 RepID=A0A2K8NTW5_9MOLU|nr:DUF262 domain-containing protein [Williamsoniiplasma luminosum]ATZ17295.1 hypothetical protein ELUMI_v1c05710 [Williamsoniiplasma luminosum]
MNLEIWKIGTNVASIINEWQEEVFPFLKNFSFVIINDSKDKYLFKYNDPNAGAKQYIATWSWSKLRQNIISLIALGVLEVVDFNKNNYISDYRMILDGNVEFRTNLYFAEIPNDELVKNYLLSKEMTDQFDDYLESAKNSELNTNTDYDSNEEEAKISFFKSFRDIVFYNSFFICLLKEIHNLSMKKFAKLIDIEKETDANKFYKYFNNIINYNNLSIEEKEKIEELAIKFSFGSREKFNRLTNSSTKMNRKTKSDDDEHKYQSVLELEDKIVNESKQKNKPMKSEIKTFGELMHNIKNNGLTFKIPIYQRDYKWNKKMIEKLFDDILKATNCEKGNEIHYMGTLLVNRPNKQEIDHNILKIVDGQQRLTSLIIILKSLYDEALDRDIVPDPFLKDLLSNKNHENLIEKRFLRVTNNPDEEAFKELLAGKDVKNPHSLIWENFWYIKDKKINSEILSDQELFDLTEFLLTKVIFTITVDSSNNEFEIFENMNTKKVELETIELIKNIIMMNIEDEILEAGHEANINSIFNSKILENFKNNKKLDSAQINNFIAAFVNYYQYYLEENDEIYKNIQNVSNNKDELYTVFKEIILKEIGKFKNKKNEKMTNEQYIELINFLNKHIILFRSVTDKKIYQNQDNSTYVLSDILINLEKRSIYTPLLMFLVQKHINNDGELINHNELRKKIFVIENYENRFQVILYRGQSLTQTMKKIFEKLIGNSNVTAEFLKKQFNSSEIMGKLTTPSNEEFITNLKLKIYDKTFKNLLRRINFWISNDFSLDIDSNYEWFKISEGTREHIVPQTLTEEWKKMLMKGLNTNDESVVIQKHNELLETIGNELLINGSPNSKAQNKIFQEKNKSYKTDPNIKDYYQYKGFKNNNLELMDLSKKDEFNFKDIKERTEQIVKILLEIYSI